MDDIDRSGRSLDTAVGGQPGGKPVRLAEDVVVDVPETEALEPRRGSRAHVSEGVPAVDDDGSVTIEMSNRSRGERLERQMQRAGEVLFVVLVLGEHLGELSARSK